MKYEGRIDVDTYLRLGPASFVLCEAPATVHVETYADAETGEYEWKIAAVRVWGEDNDITFTRLYIETEPGLEALRMQVFEVAEQDFYVDDEVRGFLQDKGALVRDLHSPKYHQRKVHNKKVYNRKRDKHDTSTEER